MYSDSAFLPFQENSTAVYIGGRWAAGLGQTITVVNPSDEEPLVTISGASPSQVCEAVDAAKDAQYDWARRPALARASLLREIGGLLRSHAEPLSRLLVYEVGKPLKYAVEEIEASAQYAEYMSEWANRIEGDIIPSDRTNEFIHLMRTPIGVVAAITAWNAPIFLLVRKLIPALAAGNTIVIKSSEVTPLTSIAVTRLLDQELDFPPGLINLVTGGKEVGRELVRNPGISMVSMTGHRDSGKQIMIDAAANLTRLSLELGGKAPAIVLADADLELAVQELLFARVTMSGQDCSAVQRLYVEASVYEDFLERYVAAAAKLKVGSPWNDVDLGPLVSRAQFDKAIEAVAEARSRGASVLVGGGRPQGPQFERGYWFAPTVITNADPSLAIIREEVFAPVIPVVKVDSFDEAMHLANDCLYGLAAYVFSTNYRSIMRAVDDVNFGELYVNRTIGESLVAYHGGWRQSGIGGEDGKYGVLAYTQIKSVYHRFG